MRLNLQWALSTHYKDYSQLTDKSTCRFTSKQMFLCQKAIIAGVPVNGYFILVNKINFLLLITNLALQTHV